ncbi:MAG TPA: Hsp20/alpha crystallin family protein [Acidimicrobiales bacterium]|nr:Hsp20/alpha crystallin family protein [Acidimicrobiales bacterium]
MDRLFQQLWANQNGTKPMAMPMDAYRKDDSFLMRLDLPGIEVDSIDLTVEDNVLTIKAERPVPPASDGIERVITERPYGSFSRQVFLGTNLDTEKIRAEYESGVLTLVVPVAEHAKPRRIEVVANTEKKHLAA